jgi:protoporphyrinogen oxidase
MDVLILGGGLSGISTAYFLQELKGIHSITLIEKEVTPGGLCRSIVCGAYVYDIGPHILFSKDKEMLDLMFSVLEERNDLRRSNQIVYKDRWLQYPFENDLSKLPKQDLDYCVNAFRDNPYAEYKADNMLQFFLSTFGEGITNTYLRPYNEKIWKYDPSYMNTSMVDRIPKPTIDEIDRSVAGETVDGYTHQLHFSYPSNGGIEAVIKGFVNKLRTKCRIVTDSAVENISKTCEGFHVFANGKEYKSDILISTIPIQELTRVCDDSEKIQTHVDNLRYNSIMVFFVKTRRDLCGENFAFMISDKDIIFHRISKMDFLGAAYKSDGATFMVEVTYRENDRYDKASRQELITAVKNGICKIHFAEDESEIEVLDVTRHKYAYVIYDVKHSVNMQRIREHFTNYGIYLNGRFGNFEYWNMDRILRESKKLCEKISHVGPMRK